MTLTLVLRAFTLQIQTANLAVWPGLIRDLVVKDCTATHSRGFGLAVLEGEGLGLGLGFGLDGDGDGVAPGLLAGLGVVLGDGAGVVVGFGVVLGDVDGVADAVLLADGVARGVLVADAVARGVPVADAVARGVPVAEAVARGVLVAEAFARGAVLADGPDRGVLVAGAVARRLVVADGPDRGVVLADAPARRVVPAAATWRAARRWWCLCRCPDLPACCTSALRVTAAGRLPHAVAALCAGTPWVATSAPPSMTPDRMETAPKALSARRPRCGMFNGTAGPPSASTLRRAGSASRSHCPRFRWDSPLSLFDTSGHRDGSQLA